MGNLGNFEIYPQPGLRKKSSPGKNKQDIRFFNEPLLCSYGAKALSIGQQQCRVRVALGGLHFLVMVDAKLTTHCVTWPETYTAPNFDMLASQRAPKIAPSSHRGLATPRQEMTVLHGGKCKTCGAPSQVGVAANITTAGRRAPFSNTHKRATAW